MQNNAQSDFARQLAQQRAGSQPTRKFRSTAVPKGTRLAQGYQDRARAREEETNDDDREARVQALEEQMKLGQIDQATFEQLRDTITGGELESTHLVKGLDRKLLERVRRGEIGDGGGSNKNDDDDAKDEAEKALEELEEREVAPTTKEEIVKKGQMAPPPLPNPIAGVKRSRNDILAEMRASRKAAEEAKATAQNTLGDRFRKIGGKNTKQYPRIEKDDQGREVLITMDENGRIKRKVRKVEVKETSSDGRIRDDKGLLIPENIAKPLGMEEVVPVLASAPEEDDDEDIFAGVGTEYDPLKAEMDAAGATEATSSSEEDDDEDDVRRRAAAPKPVADPSDTAESPVKLSTSPSRNLRRRSSGSESPASIPGKTTGQSMVPQQAEPHSPEAGSVSPVQATASSKRNYFNTKSTNHVTSPQPPREAINAPFKDPTILAALKRASTIASRAAASEAENKATNEPSTAAQRLLGNLDRDYEDMDMGFGASRGGDEDDGEGDGGSRVKLSQWKGLRGELNEGDDVDDQKKKGKGGKSERKRGGKKRKGNKESAADILRVIESRKKT